VPVALNFSATANTLGENKRGPDESFMLGYFFVGAGWM
jgi:hypothetical protein